MFDKIIISRKGRSLEEPVDLGFLAECLVFYRRVSVVADSGTFKFLVRVCGPDALLELMEMGALEILYFDNGTAVVTVQLSDGGDCNDYGNYTSNNIRYPQVSRALFDELCGPSGRGANRLYRRFEKYVRRTEYTPNINREVVQDFADEKYLTAAAGTLLSYLAPSYQRPTPLKFTPIFIPKFGHRIVTNIDFSAPNVEYHKTVPSSHGSLSTASILAHIADTRRDVRVASTAEADVSLSEAGSLVCTCKFAEIIAASDSRIAAIDSFQEQILDELPDIAEAVNSGRRSFPEILPVVRAAGKFKDWLEKAEDATAVMSDYAKEVSRLDWADRLPAKSSRCLIMCALGAATGALNPIAGMALATGLNAADYFLLDKLLKRWKPNQFVEGPLKKFLKF
ncbi:MAG: hypothetical protein WB711_13000 [Terriglobales bacterium]